MNETYRKMLEDSIIPFNETLDSIVQSLEGVIQNKALSLKYLQPKKAQLKFVANSNSFESLREKYNNWKETSKAVNRFDVLSTFYHEGVLVNPDKSVTNLIDSLDNLYLLFRDRGTKTVNAKIYSLPIFASKTEHDYWNTEFTKNLDNMVNSAEEVGMWVNHLSTRNYMVFPKFFKNYANKEIAKLGIPVPEFASQDLKILAVYAKDYLKKLVYTQPKLYPD